MSTTEAKPGYFIDLNWYEENERSFPMLAQGRLCPSCRGGQSSAAKTNAEFFAVFRDCCSEKEDFFASNLPLREMIFRLFLSNGNQPLDLKEINSKLKEWLLRTGDSRQVSIPKLSRIMESDRYYGFRPFPEEKPKNT